MSLGFIDGAEHRIPTPPLMVGAGGTTHVFANSAPTARYGGGTYYYAVPSGGKLRWLVPTASLDPEVWCGFAFYQDVTLAGTSQPMWIIQGDGVATTHLSLHVNSDGSVSLYRGTSAGTLLGSSAASVLNLATWAYVEMRALIDDTVGAYEIRVDGVNVLSGSGADTRNGGTSPNVTVIGGARTTDSAPNVLYDDIYCVTGDGTGSSGFQSEIVVEGIIPSGNGNYSQLVGQDGDSTNNYLNVDEVPFSSTDYNGSTTTGNKDTYAYSNLTATSGTILGSVLHFAAFKNAAGFIKGRRVIRISATDYNGSDTPVLSGTMRYFSEVLPTSPATAAAWTISEVNGLEAGFEVRPA